MRSILVRSNLVRAILVMVWLVTRGSVFGESEVVVPGWEVKQCRHGKRCRIDGMTGEGLCEERRNEETRFSEERTSTLFTSVK